MFAYGRTCYRSAATKPPIDIFNGDFEMRVLSMIAVAGAMIASSAGAFAGELPAYEVKSFPISAMQVQVLGATGVEQQPTAATMTVAGMPASPAQMSVLSPRVKRLASANADAEAR
ncbi:hypothetical protein ACFQZO_31715 [Bradyrhizobium sp. GCM10027634]|uniref:hypothetical protein n=1 Tax=unclassified Bradyrhizobium TaxID=2631580 RepID=UPI0018C07D44|nr:MULTISPECIES: hypothetical protein [unclassified Bradyrhizobium]MDN5005428.1 hypothetical protein [Bradyrhizobium sp. WYCCWR 12677]QOZ44141.1 hypothetical protein XH89_12095 [Bradyrhizobium sp. CCBAU 53340]